MEVAPAMQWSLLSQRQLMVCSLHAFQKHHPSRSWLLERGMRHRKICLYLKLFTGVWKSTARLPSSFGCSYHWVTSPDAVEDVAVSGDPQKLVVCGNLMEMGPFLISEEQVRLPDGVQHRGVQVQRVVRVFIVRQPWVIPLLSQEDVHPVILHSGSREERNAVSAQSRLKVLRTGDHVLKPFSKPNHV